MTAPVPAPQTADELADRDGLLFVGTATVLLRHGGLTLLTDPNFLHRGQWAHLGHGLRSRRRTDPAIEPEQVPTPDAVVLSHLHGDHFDRVARARLGLQDRGVPVVTTPQSARCLDRERFTTAPLEPWQDWSTTTPAGRITVTAVPGRHAPGAMQRLLPAVMGSVLELAPTSGRPLRAYVTGDTLLVPELAEVTERFPDLDLVLLHLGGTRVLGIKVTMDGDDGVDLLELLRLGPRTTAVPVHYDDYGLFRSPLSEFLDAVARRHPRARVQPVARGELLPIGALVGGTG